MSAAKTPLRKDAARNRALLLETAQALFRSQGLTVTLKDVAQAAGVGVGTVYRHFPTKDDLVAAIFASQLEAELSRAQLAAAEEDAWQALVNYLEETMRIQSENRGLRALMRPQGSVYESVRSCKMEMNPHIEQVIERAHTQGTLKKECTARDIAFLQVALVGIMDTDPAEPERYQRHLQFFLEGIRAK